MHLRVACGLILGLVLTAAVAPAHAQPAPTPRVVNITPDSEKGWIPTVELEASARNAANAYLAARDGGHGAEAYAMNDPLNQKDQSPAAFAKALQDFNALAGPVQERRIVYLTWTKDPPGAPAPGVYAAFDLVSRFANVDRHCGYLMLRQAPGGGPFRVTGEESNFMDNATARRIAKDQSSGAVDQIWAKLSSYCPNYPQPPLAESEGQSIGYSTVAEALADLHSKPAVAFTTERGWTIATDQATMTLWSFPPKGDPAYPSAVKRQVVADGKATSLKMSVLCEASKEACDNLVRQFEGLNAQALGPRRR